ncbi:MAG TPA: hypothetical protein PLB49_12705 [Chitinophagaceae bacterium]|nr:hypothetical protein [Chitinophagaceae bacterium]
MKKTFILFIAGILCLSSCKKESLSVPESKSACSVQTSNPSGRSYSADSVISYPCTGSFCGLMPMNSNNFWIYEDSLFTDGVFKQVQYDTLRFTGTYRSLNDGLVWWESNISVGLPEKMYASDSALFSMEDRMFMEGIKDVKKEYGLFAGDSLRYLTAFEDAAAIGRSLKMTGTLSTPAGDFSHYLFIEKNARNFRKDQVCFMPGVGVIKYRQEKAVMGSPVVKLQKVSTLVKYYIE